MNTFILVDSANMFARARFSVSGDIDTKLGMALHIVLHSVRKAWKDFNGTHVVFCLEGRSWRKDVYKPYKANRAVAKAALTEREVMEDMRFWQTFDEFATFVKDKTNCTVLQHPQLEADDLIAGFIQHHPNDNHVIISSDSDFVQLIAPNVSQYNGISDTHITINGYFDAKGKPIKDKKTKEPKSPPNPEWLLFEKCIRGDSSDNIFSAYPKVRSTKLKEAFEDRNSQGFAWHNLLLQRFMHHDGTEHRVLDDFNRNRMLIDLTAQPLEIRDIITAVITENAIPKSITQVGIRFLKLCEKYKLVRISEQAQSYAEPLNARFPL